MNMKNITYKDYKISYDADALRKKRDEIIRDSGVRVEKNRSFKLDSDEYKKFKASSIDTVDSSTKDRDDIINNNYNDIIIKEDFMGGGVVDVTYIHTEKPNIAKSITNFLNHKDPESIETIFEKDSSREIIPYGERLRVLRDAVSTEYDTIKRTNLARKLSILISTAKYNYGKKDPSVYYSEVKNMIFKKGREDENNNGKSRGAHK